MRELNQAFEWMREQLRVPEPLLIEKHVISLERHNLAELENLERLASANGIEAFEYAAKRLAALHVIDPHAPILSIPLCIHPSVIGMSEGLFQVLGRVCDQLVEHEPLLLERSSYRCRNSHCTALPLSLWLDIFRFAREQSDPAAFDTDFFAARQKEGLSNREAFKALIASKRAKR